ncbi:Decaprenyl-diphosphate synthase subunit 1, partial [Trichinella patagoniensis]
MWFEIPNSCVLRSCVRNLFRFYRVLRDVIKQGSEQFVVSYIFYGWKNDSTYISFTYVRLMQCFEKSDQLYVNILFIFLLNFCITDAQYKIAMIAEMIHTASLVHDDVVDDSDRRRNIPTVNATHGYKTATFFGDIILAKATILLTSINNAEVISIVSKILDDLVKGELIQMESGSDESRLFSEYLAKCYKKTGSLFSNSLKAAAVLANCSELCVKNVYQFGRNFGLMFQLVDDLLDFCSVDSTTLGKPSRVDLQLGIVTAPVLFAAGQKLEIVKMIRRKFSRPTDVSRCMELVLNESDGIFRTRQLIEQFADQAVRCLNDFPNCQLKLALQQLCKDCATRKA